MKKLISGIALGLLATMGSAGAADMALKAPPIAPIVDPWTGWYVGANVGYSWAHWSTNNTAGAALFPAAGGFGTNDNPNVKGWLGGVQAGYNWHFSPQALFGLEADIDASGERASDGATGVLAAVNVPFNPLPGFPGSNPGCRVAGCTLTTVGNDTNNWKLQWLSTFRARFGITPDPSLLLYATGGLAIAGTHFATTAGATTATLTSNFNGQVLSVVAGAGGVSAAGTETRAGFAVGAGVEKKIAQNWSVRAEYLYVDLGSHTFLAGTGLDTNIRMRDNIARAGIQYFFPR